MSIVDRSDLVGDETTSVRPAAPRTLTSLLRRARAPIMVVLGLSAALAIWSFLSYVVIGPDLMPSPWDVAETGWPILLSGELFGHMAVSLSRIGIGMALGTVVGVIGGLMIGRFRVLRELVDPPLELLRYTSPTAMIPIAVIWFGIGEPSKYFLVFWGVVFIVLVNTWAGVQQTPRLRERSAQCMGARERHVFWIVVLPSTVPYIYSGIRIALASAFVSVIPAELLAAQSGLGYMLQAASVYGQVNRIFVALVTITVLGFTADLLIRLIFTRLFKRYLRTS